MKVTLQENYRSVYTLDELDQAKTVIAYEKDDSFKPADYAMTALNLIASGIGGHAEEIITASAHTARYCNAWNAYGNDTGRMDIEIDGIGKVWTEKGRCFVEFSAMLTDIWSDYLQPAGTWYKVYRSEN